MSTLFAQINASFNRFCAAWTTDDSTAVADCLVDGGSLINPFGQRANWRTAVAATYAAFFGGGLRGTATTVTLGSVRAVEADHAFADGEQTITAPDGAVIVVSRLAALLQRDGDCWRFVDARPYACASPG